MVLSAHHPDAATGWPRGVDAYTDRRADGRLSGPKTWLETGELLTTPESVMYS
jgi:hypothetical protein